MKLIILKIFLSSLIFSQSDSSFTSTTQYNMYAKVKSLNENSRKISEEAPEKAVDLGRKALEISFEYNLEIGIAESYLSIGGGLENLGAFDKSLEYYFKALTIFENLKIKDRQAFTLDSIGYIYWYLSLFDKALDYYKKALELAKKSNDSIRMTDVYNHMGLVYWRQGKFEEALNNYAEGMSIAKKINYNHGISAIKNNRVYIYFEYGDLEKALKEAKEVYSLKLEKEGRRIWGLTEVLNTLGSIYTKMGDYKKAYLHLNKAYKNAEKIKSKVLLIDNSYYFAKYYNKLGDYKKSADYYKLWGELKDSLYTEKKSHKIAELQSIFLLEKKEKEINQLNSIKQYQESEIKTQKEINRLYILILIIIVIGSVVGIIIQRKKTEIYKHLVSKNLAVTKSEIKIRTLKKKISEETNQIEPTFDKSTELLDQINEDSSDKYSTSPLTDEQKNKILSKINNAFENEKIFIQQDLSINKLADFIGVSRTYISQVINEKIGKSFINLINEYRIKEACILFTEEESKLYTIEHISKQVGYNSITSFNRAFKKNTGVTPTFYMKSLKTDS